MNKFLVLVLAATISLAGCKPGSAYHVAAKLGDDVAGAVKVGIDALDAGIPQITPDAQKGVAHWLKNVNGFNQAYINQVTIIHTQEMACVAASKTATQAVASCDRTAQYLDTAQRLATAVQNEDMQKLLHITNPDSQAKVDAIAAPIAALISAAEISIAQIKGK